MTIILHLKCTTSNKFFNITISTGDSCHVFSFIKIPNGFNLIWSIKATYWDLQSFWWLISHNLRYIYILRTPFVFYILCVLYFRSFFICMKICLGLTYYYNQIMDVQSSYLNNVCEWKWVNYFLHLKKIWSIS